VAPQTAGEQQLAAPQPAGVPPAPNPLLQRVREQTAALLG
jgi:hypothetical protein